MMATFTGMNDLAVADEQVAEWHEWQPNREKDSNETEDWAEFIAWCDQWAKWTRCVPVRHVAKGEEDTEPRRPEWHARVYAGRKE